MDRLREFIHQLPRDLTHVFEFRNASWYREDVRRLLVESRMCFCIHDMRGVFSPHGTTGPAVYLRFHGPTDRAYAGSYPRSYLEKWVEEINSIRRDVRDVYAYFNNHDQAFVVANAREMQLLLGVTPLVTLPA